MVDGQSITGASFVERRDGTRVATALVLGITAMDVLCALTANEGDALAA